MDQAIADLQRDAADPAVSVSRLVRAALAVAMRVKDEEMGAWLRSEMNGYPTMRDAPDYRWAQGQVRVWNALRGWIPVVFQDPAEEERISRVASTQSIGELEGLLGEDFSRGVYGVPFPPHVAQQITRGNRYLTNPMVQVPRTSLQRVLDRVRNRILEWTLRYGVADGQTSRAGDGPLDRRGVVIAGPIVDSQVQIGSSNSPMSIVDDPVDIDGLVSLVAELRGALPTLNLPRETASQLSADLETMESQVKAPKPRYGLLRNLASLVGETLKSAGGAIAAELAKRFLNLPPAS